MWTPTPPQVHNLADDSCRLGRLVRAAVGNTFGASALHFPACPPASPPPVALDVHCTCPPACLPADCEDGRRQTVDPKTVAACASAQVRATSAQLLAAGFGAVSVMSKRGKLAPLRTVFYHNQGGWHACVLRCPACTPARPVMTAAVPPVPTASGQPPALSHLARIRAHAPFNAQLSYLMCRRQ
jgi:hypothetical protein